MNSANRRRAGFTLVEVLIVVVIMAILAATIIPQFSDSTNDAKVSTLEFNLHTLRAQIELYKAQHDGNVPALTLIELISSTNAAGTVGTGVNFPYGPYMRIVPTNPFSSPPSAVVRAAGANPPAAASGETDAGWLYDVGSGGVWIDHPDHYDK